MGLVGRWDHTVEIILTHPAKEEGVLFLDHLCLDITHGVRWVDPQGIVLPVGFLMRTSILNEQSKHHQLIFIHCYLTPMIPTSYQKSTP